MSVAYKVERFSKPGKGFPQTVQLDNEGNVQKDKEGKEVTGNEQYTCNQLTDESIDPTNAETFIEDVLSAVEGDLAKAAECFRTGWNRVTRISAAGLDEYQKAAKGIIKLGLPMAKGLSVDELADKLRAMNAV